MMNEEDSNSDEKAKSNQQYVLSHNSLDIDIQMDEDEVPAPISSRHSM